MQVDRELLQNELDKIVEGLKKLGARKIVLFGSLARGEPRLSSDIDLLAIFEDADNFKSRMRRVYSEIESRADFDILAYNRQEYERVKDRSLFRNIAREGKVLYEAKP
jgi:predicted nucleotidyltransferase